MNSSCYYDNGAAVQVLGCLLKEPTLFDNEGQYSFNDEDFDREFHKVMFNTIRNLYYTGTKIISTVEIEEYLKDKEHSRGVYKAAGGNDWVTNTINAAVEENFKYNYDKLKKLSLLRAYNDMGLDVEYLYPINELFDLEKKQTAMEQFDDMTLIQIADKIENRIDDIRLKCVENITEDAQKVGNGIFDLLTNLKKTPEMGIPLYGKYMNSITRGARLGKLYIRSAATGLGKTRSMIGDCCNFACTRMWVDDEWKNIGLPHSTLYISTELDLEEVQTMCLAFISGVNEEKILKQKFDWGEEERVIEAAKVLQEAPLYIEITPDFSLKDIENLIKRSIRVHDVEYCGFDYIHTSMKILEEVSKRSGGVKLREDNILFLLSNRLKDIATQYNVFILTSTQLNADFKTSDTPDQTLLRGAKSIADKADWGSILLEPTAEDYEKLEEILKTNDFPKPNVKLSVYKNRRGSFTHAYLWMNADRATCRFDGIFATDYRFNPIAIEDDYEFVERG